MGFQIRMVKRLVLVIWRDLEKSGNLTLVLSDTSGNVEEYVSLWIHQRVWKIGKCSGKVKEFEVENEWQSCWFLIYECIIKVLLIISLSFQC